MLRQGQIQGDRAARSGEILGNAVAGLGQQIGGAIQQHSQQKALKKQDQAFVNLLQQSGGKPDPRQVIGIYGIEKGPAIFKAWESLQSPEPDLNVVLAGFEAARPEVRALGWPLARHHLIKGGIPETQVPQDYDDGWYQRFKGALKPEKAPESFTLSEGQTRFGPDGKPLAAVAPKAPTPQGFTLGAGEVRYGADGKPIASRPPKPEAPKAPQIERIETVDENGKPVTKFVTPKVGDAYAKPTGAGKPATGQQRKALGFFNRAKEAGEIASSLEEGKTISPAAIKYTPELLNFLRSSPDQAYIQAQRAFTEARLRKDSGAAVPKHEYETDAVTYFAQPGDDEATKAQKRAGRNAILASIGFESGDALREFYGDEAEGMIEGYKSASKAQGGPKRINSDADYDALPSGTEFIAPDGSRRRKP